MDILKTPGEYPRLAGRVAERDGCWVWVHPRQPQLIMGSVGRKKMQPTSPVNFVRVVIGLTRTGKASKPTCGHDDCINPAHWRTRPPPPKVPYVPPRKMSHEMAAAIRSDYRVLCRRILDDNGGDKRKAQLSVKAGREPRIRLFFDRMMWRYNLGRSTVRHAAYGTRGGLKYQPRQDRA